MKAVWKSVVVADSDATRVVEGNHYFPPESIDRKYFKDSKTTTNCPWKGEASYYTLDVDGTRNEDAALALPDAEGSRCGDQELHRVLARRRGHRVAGTPVGHRGSSVEQARRRV